MNKEERNELENRHMDRLSEGWKRGWLKEMKKGRKCQKDRRIQRKLNKKNIAKKVNVKRKKWLKKTELNKINHSKKTLESWKKEKRNGESERKKERKVWFLYLMAYQPLRII